MAYDSDDSIEDVESEPDSGDEGDMNFPAPPVQIKRLHQRMGEKIIKPFFKSLDGPIGADKLTKALSAANEKIQEDNATHRRDINLFTVPPHKLLACQFTQRHIAMNYKLGVIEPQLVHEKIQLLQDYFEKTRGRGLYQWPEAWTALLIKPLQKELIKNNLPEEQAKTKPTLMKPTPTKPAPTKPTPASGDTDMPDADSRSPQQTVQKEKKELRTLAYSLSRRPSSARGMGFNSFKTFVEVEGANPLKVKKADEVDVAEILACCNSKDGNNIKEKEGMYRMIDRTDFIGIIGVAFMPGSGGYDRTPWTYVWVKIKGISDHEPIMTRSILRDWLSTKKADSLIDQFLVKSGTVPPWAMANNDPEKDMAYRPLTYPLPKKQSRRNDQIAWMQPDDNYYADDGDKDNHPLPRNRGYRPQENAIQELTTKMDSITNMFHVFMEEGRQQREQTNAILLRLLPPSS